ncbi:GH3 auxin-responsive promoter family protein [Cyclobacteriaceae bacterium]|nr:GH3 auxin-responsive promoter family protein [Cyclobacteriaceae bacterium]MDB4602962.1 GH3 auxin-responsive promoter family protein [Cyclobacteriaceae bacterium]
MGIRSILSKPLAKWIVYDQKKWALNPGKFQSNLFRKLIKSGSKTQFGRDHQFDEIRNHTDFTQRVPIRDYEELKPYINEILEGKKDVLWPGLPAYLAKTSGTTSGVKYIPITKDSIPNHINSARNALLSYVNETGNSTFLDKKLIFLSGSPTLTYTSGIPTGRLSGIVNHLIPTYLKSNQLPSYPTNCLEDWEQKVDQIVLETENQDLSLISGIPPWVQMYFDKLVSRKGKSIKDVFPNFSLFVYGGVNFDPYQKKLYETIGKTIDSIETYPASEGFIAYQDSQASKGLLLLSNSGIFFEFIAASDFFNESRKRLTLEEVEIGVNYAVILNSNAGLWGYAIGDTVKFLSTYPHRIIVTGRIKHFISAFGEHVIGEEVEKAMTLTCQKFPETELIEYTVAPQVTPTSGLPLHEWYIAFAQRPHDVSAFKKELNLNMQQLNSYYDDLVRGAVLDPLQVVTLKADAFIKYMKSIGKLGGQNKVPRLSNDRKIVEALHPFKEK